MARSGPAPKSKRARSEVPTQPPPKTKSGGVPRGRQSQVKPRKSTVGDGGATVDEVVADLSRDPRRDDD